FWRLRRHDSVDGFGQPGPIGGFGAKMSAAGPCDRIEFGRAAGVALLPYAANPTFVFELMQGRIERAVADLESFVGHLTQALGDGPAGSRLEVEDLENQQIEGAL